MRSPLKVAAFQMATADDVAANERRIHEGIAQAAEGGAGLLVLPECALSGYLPAPHLDYAGLAQAQDRIAAAVAGAGIWLALGTTSRQGGRLYNTALLLSPAGEAAARYDKTHLMPDEVRVFEPGRSLPVFSVGEWTVGIQICFDMRFAENWRILRRKGAQVVVHLSNASRSAAWKVPVLEGAVRSRAAENGMFVVSANDARRPQMMVSAILDPDGRDLARAPENREAMIFAELDRRAVTSGFLQARRTDLWSEPDHSRLLLS